VMDFSTTYKIFPQNTKN